MIDTKAHYFVPMRPVHHFMGLCSYTSSDDEAVPVLCSLEPYDFSEYEYKLYAEKDTTHVILKAWLTMELW